MKFVLQQDIRAPLPLSFAAASDVRAWPNMISCVEKTELLTREPIGPGTRFRATRRVHGRLASEVMTLAEFDPPERFVITAFNHGARYRIEHQFKDLAPGTRLTLVYSARPITRIARLMTPVSYLFRSSLLHQIRSDLSDLRHAIEGQSRGARD